MILPSLSRPFAAALLSAALMIVLPPSAGAQQAQRPARQEPTRPAQATPEKPPAPSGQARPAAGASPTSRTTQPRPTGGRAGPASALGGSAAALVASFGDWGVYTAQTGRTKICYALTQPKDRQPKNVNRDPAYLFVSFRPAENVRNEVALVMGFSTRENAAAEASIGNAKYDLLTKDQNAWLKNPAEESQAITTMARGQNVVVKAQSSRGNLLTDRYSLSGFGQALERARRECS